MNELARILINISNIVPAGVVCFFPSYDYENTFVEYISKSGDLSKLSVKKRVSTFVLIDILQSVLSGHLSFIREWKYCAFFLMLELVFFTKIYLQCILLLLSKYKY